MTVSCGHGRSDVWRLQTRWCTHCCRHSAGGAVVLEEGRMDWLWQRTMDVSSLARQNMGVSSLARQTMGVSSLARQTMGVSSLARQTMDVSSLARRGLVGRGWLQPYIHIHTH
eukprot:scaffold56235_cov27-Tisochrysis_lutea.AAC.1